MKPIIISAFGGTGKSTFTKNNPNLKILDLDSSYFDKSNFPDNYTYKIRDLWNFSDYDYILISSHLDVRIDLYNMGVPYVLVYPDISLKQEYLKRYTSRNSPKSFVNTFNKLWEEFVYSCEEDMLAKKKFKLKSSEYLKDIFKRF